ncbi:unnamed protein product [Prunus brigantina]
MIFMRSTVLEKEDLEEYTRQSCYQVKLSHNSTRPFRRPPARIHPNSSFLWNTI